MARFKENTEWGARNLVDFVKLVRSAVSPEGAGLVHMKGEKASVGQLPSDAAEGDIWFVTLPQRFYLRHGGAWLPVCTLRQADTVDELPEDPVQLAAFAATLEEGAHLTALGGAAGTAATWLLRYGSALPDAEAIAEGKDGAIFVLTDSSGT